MQERDVLLRLHRSHDPHQPLRHGGALGRSEWPWTELGVTSQSGGTGIGWRIVEYRDQPSNGVLELSIYLCADDGLSPAK